MDPCEHLTCDTTTFHNLETAWHIGRTHVFLPSSWVNLLLSREPSGCASLVHGCLYISHHIEDKLFDMTNVLRPPKEVLQGK